MIELLETLGPTVAKLALGIVQALIETPASERARVAKSLLRTAEIAAKVAATDLALSKIPAVKRKRTV